VIKFSRPPPKVFPPIDDAVLSLFGKSIKIVAIRGQIFGLKYTNFYFGWGWAPDPTWGA